VKLAALIDRGGRELPIQGDFVGKTISATKGDDVIVSLKEAGGNDEVILKSRVKAEPAEHKTRKRGKK
jgi:pyrimidine operon attenuation protein/uracil phosphoribosyltransferase